MRGNKKSLSLLVYALIAVVVLGVGYAAISAIPLTINGTATATGKQENFVVEFNDAEGKITISDTASNAIKNFDETATGGNKTQAYIDTTNDATKKTAKFDLYGFTTKDETATVTYTVINRSQDLKAKLCTADIQVSGGSNTTFTSVASLPSATGTPACVTLDANGGETTIQVVTTLNTTPAVDDVTATDLTVTFTAQPVANR